MWTGYTLARERLAVRRRFPFERVRFCRVRCSWKTGPVLLPLVVAVMPAVFIPLVGCGTRSDSAANKGVALRPVEQKARRGPVEMLVRADRDKVGVAEKLRLTVEVRTSDDVDVEMPKPPDKLGEFQVRSVRDEPGVPVEQGRRWWREYTLESYLAGDYEIPSPTVSFIDRRGTGRGGTTTSAEGGIPASQPARNEISTPALKIKVTSLIEGEFNPSDFRDIKNPVELPRKRSWEWLVWLAILALAVVVILTGRSVWRRRMTAPTRVRIVPPHEWAREQFRLLQAERFVERHEVHEFYFRLTWIVRQYIERRFGIMAAEQTTEEFLAAAKDHPSLGGSHKAGLSGFLQAADLVKFAKYAPGEAESNQALGAAEAFVDQTTREAGMSAQPREASI